MTWEKHRESILKGLEETKNRLAGVDTRMEKMETDMESLKTTAEKTNKALLEKLDTQTGIIERKTNWQTLFLALIQIVLTVICGLLLANRGH